LMRPSLLASLRARLRRLPAWLLPQACLLCGGAIDRGLLVCAGCDRSLPRLGPACPRCASPYEEADAALPCGRCQQEPPAHTRVLAPFRYGAPIDRLVQGAKYHGRLDWTAALSRLWLRERLATASIDALVAVPLHRARLRERGYNQALELARPLAAAFKLPLLLKVERVRATPPQTGLSREERRRNLRDAFVARENVSGLRLAIVDDVITSGATAEALTRCLLKAGAQSVEVWVVARA
jgi:ComF family protein